MKISEHKIIKALEELSPNGFKLWAFCCCCDSNNPMHSQIYAQLLYDEEDYISAFEELKYNGYLQNAEGFTCNECL